MKLTEDKKVRIFRKDREYSGGTFATYSMGISSKSQDGSYIKGYIDCCFKKGVEVADKTDIKIIHAFPVVRNYQGKGYVSWMITEFEIVNEGQKPIMTEPNEGFFSVPEGTDSELPFAMPTR